jgi:hypothetical protein
MIAILSHRDSASSILWVVKISEQFGKCFSMVNKLLLETGSTPVVGSSKNSTDGQASRDIAQTNFLLFPPLKLSDFTEPYEFRSRVVLMNSF